MTDIIDFPGAKPKVEDLMASMKRHWQSGKRLPESPINRGKRK